MIAALPILLALAAPPPADALAGPDPISLEQVLTSPTRTPRPRGPPRIASGPPRPDPGRPIPGPSRG